MLGGAGRAVAISGSGRLLLAVVLATSRPETHGVLSVKGHPVLVLDAQGPKKVLGSGRCSLTGRLVGTGWFGGRLVRSLADQVAGLCFLRLVCAGALTHSWAPSL